MDKHSISGIVAFILTAGSVLLLASCPSPLLTGIQDTVEIAVTPPGVQSVYPGIGETEVPVNTGSIIIIFDKYIDRSTVSGSTVTVSNDSGDPEDITFNVNNETIEISLVQLDYDTEYTVTVTTAVKDTDGNELPSEYTWTFRTGLSADTSPPVVTAAHINVLGDTWSTSHDVEVSITATDNRSVTKVQIINEGESFSDSGFEAYNGTPVTHTLAPGEGLKNVLIKVQDGVGLVSDVFDAATIQVDTVAPTFNFVLLNGGDSATGAATISFEVSAADIGSGTENYQYRMGTGGVFGAWAPWAALSSGGAIIPSIPLTVPVGEAQDFEVVVSDVAGNVSAVNASRIYFDQAAPSVQSKNFGTGFFPFNGTVLSIVFTEEMDGSTINPTTLSIATVLNPTEIVVGPADYLDPATSTVQKNRRAVISGMELAPQTQYTVTLSSTVKDVAGNALGSDQVWFFSTGEAEDSEPPEITSVALQDPGGLDTVKELPTGTWASSTNIVNFELKASDDYSLVEKMRMYGSSADPATYPEDVPSTWTGFVGDDVTPMVWPWQLSSGSGTKYVILQLRDSALNVTEEHRIKIYVDDVDPVFGATPVVIDSGTGFTNNPSGDITVYVSASDADSGLEFMHVAEADATINPNPTEAWTPEYAGLSLSGNDGSRLVYVTVYDYLGRTAQQSETIFLDRGQPEFTVHEGTFTTSGTYTLSEGADPASNDYDVFDPPPGSNIKEVRWSLDSGPGPLTFDYTGDSSGDQKLMPEITGTVEGTYYVKATAEDNAGNTASTIFTFIVDTSAPAAPTNVIGPTLTNNPQPTWSWDPVTDADIYECTIGAVTYYTTETSISWPDALTEGSVDFAVRASDSAGNKSSPASAPSATIDYTPPAVSNDGQVYIANIASGPSVTIDISGTVIDLGSGAANVTLDWSKSTGPSTLNFSPVDGSQPVVSLSGTEGTSLIELEMTDLAGNIGYGYFTIIWDAQVPGAPVVSAPAATKDRTPTWTWIGGGGGNGQFYYRVEYNSSVELEAGGPLAVLQYDLTPALDAGDGTYNWTLYVREADAAGNLSQETAKTVLVDTYSVPPPFMSEIGLTNVNPPIFVWTSGTQEGVDPGPYSYELFIDGASEAVFASSPNHTETHTPAGALSTGVQYSAYVEETYGLDTKQSATILFTIDTTPPTPPTVAPFALSPAGLATQDVDRWATSDDTPGWTWTSVDGNGIFDFRLNDGSTDIVTQTATTDTSYVSTTLGEGTYTMFVSEYDDAGNTSPVASYQITIDKTDPILTTVTINVGDPAYTATAGVVMQISANVAGESGPVVMDYSVDSSISYTGTWVPYAPTYPISLSAANGVRTVYIQLRDEAGNLSTAKSDDISLDTLAPTGSFTINGGDTSTPWLEVTLNSTVSDNVAPLSDIMVQQSYQGADYPWQPYAASLPAMFSFDMTSGSHVVTLRFIDGAGNVSGDSLDSIDVDGPIPLFATKGLPFGQVQVQFGGVNDPQDPGGSNTIYNIFAADSEIADPNTGYPVIFAGSTVTAGYAEVIAPELGKLWWYFVQAENTLTGSAGPFSIIPVLGFSSDSVVVYNKDNPDDEDLANRYKALLETPENLLGFPEISGAPDVPMTVTLLPDHYVESFYDESQWIYGNPVILAPHVTPDEGRFQNIVTGIYSYEPIGSILAWGTGGMAALEAIEMNWLSWMVNFQAGDPGAENPPYDITGNPRDYPQPYRVVQSMNSFESEDIWMWPFISELTPGGENPVNFWYDDSRGDKLTVQAWGGNPFEGGFGYAKDPNSNNHYVAARQGRFGFVGFFYYPDTPTGEMFIYNMVSRLKNVVVP